MTRFSTAVAVCSLSMVALAQGDPPPDEAALEIPNASDQEGQIELSLADALRLGAINNTNLKASELEPRQSSEDVRAARAIFEPELYADVSAAQSESPDRIFQAAGFAQPAIRQERYRGRFGVRQLVPSGGLFDLAFAPSKLLQSSVGGPIRREYTTDFTVTYTQPLLRSAWTDYTLSDIHVQEASRAGTAFRYEQSIQTTLLSIVQAYWDLVFARENYLVVAQALGLAQQQLDRTNRKIEVGEVAPLDRVSDEAEVARRREELITAENSIRSREDQLRRQVFDDADGSLWTRGLVPTTEIGAFPEQEDLDWRQLARAALRNRPDLRAMRSDVAIAETLLTAAERDVLPSLDLVGSYTTDGTDSVFPDALSQSTHFDFPDWSVQLQFSVPVGNNAARASRDRAQLEVERMQRLLHSAEIDVELEVREAVRQLRTLTEAIARGRESERLALSNLRREQARKEAGTSTSFEVQQRLQELQEAKSRLLRNRLDYRIAESNLRYVQGLLEPVERSDAGDENAGEQR